MKVSNLLIVAGTGNKSGKTTFACRLIEQFKSLGIISIKITPHFHETTAGLKLIKENTEYSIYEETDPESSKDTSRMLKAGAVRVYFAKVNDNSLFEAFKNILDLIPSGAPVVCESPALRYKVDPGLFIIMMSAEKDNQKDINKLLSLPHVELNMTFLSGCKKLPVDFKNGKWESLS
ncbi:MAG: hypothetical protein WAL29_00555 [Bacteroidales bacterium]